MGIQAIWEKGKRKYIINIEKERYVTDTENIIMDVKAEGLYSAGTRIFRVYNQNDKNKEHPLILKDYWPATVYDTEVETRSKILDSIFDKEECGWKETISSEDNAAFPKEWRELPVSLFVGEMLCRKPT